MDAKGLGFYSQVDQIGHSYPVHMSNIRELQFRSTVLGSSFCVIINFLTSQYRDYNHREESGYKPNDDITKK